MGCLCEKHHSNKNKSRFNIQQYASENNFSNIFTPKKKIPNKKLGRIDNMIIDKNLRKTVDFDTQNIVSKCVCKIKLKLENEEGVATGFFLIYKNKRYLITCKHVIKPIIKEFMIEIYNKKRYNFDLKNHEIHLLDKPIDIAAIEIKNSDKFISDIGYLDYDLNYIKGYSQYIDKDIFIFGYQKGLNSTAESGKLKKINNFEFFHDINTDHGSSGSPVILFNTLKVIGIHKQGDKDENLNVGTFINFIFKEIDNIKSSKIYNINEINKINQDFVIDIEISNKYMCIINYKLFEKEFKDLGFLIKIPNANNSFSITGILTKYYVEENIFNKIKKINLYNNHNILEGIDSKEKFIISDKFLNITFIEIKNLSLDYISIFDNNNISDSITLINYSQKFNGTNINYGKILEKWGIFIIYQEDEDKYYMNPQSSFIPSGLIIKNKLLGIFKQNSFKNKIATNIDAISKVIKLNYMSKIKDSSKYYEKIGTLKPLSEAQKKELERIGLTLSEIPNILVSPEIEYIRTPIWFLRTKHAWYWTPIEPSINDLYKSNWMIIYPENSVKVIGGEWDGDEPVKKNIDIIHYLEKSSIKYL